MIARTHPTPGRRLRRGVVLGVVVVLATLLSRPLVGQVPTAAAQGSRTFSCIANPDNYYQSFTVPGGVTELGVVATAGAGESRGDGHGGLGGRVTAYLHVTPGQTLTVVVGCPGLDGSGGVGYGFGGEHGRGHAPAAHDGGGGGGGSAVLGSDGNTILVVAGGGGGGGGHSATADAGGNGGNPPQSGQAGDPSGQGGDGGRAACGVNGLAGGSGESSSVADGGGGGGGGGGGYPGGCGGHTAFYGGGGGGGAGGSYATPAAWGVTYSTPSAGWDGQVQLDWWQSSAPGEPQEPGPAAPAQPMTVTGQVHHVLPPLVSEGQTAQSLTPHTGAQVEALVGDTVCGTVVTDAMGRFQLTVAADPATPACGRPGATVRFRVDGREQRETVAFRSGGTAAVALRLADGGGAPPTCWGTGIC